MINGQGDNPLRTPQDTDEPFDGLVINGYGIYNKRDQKNLTAYIHKHYIPTPKSEWVAKVAVPEEWINIKREFDKLYGVIRTLERENAELKYKLSAGVGSQPTQPSQPTSSRKGTK